MNSVFIKKTFRELRKHAVRYFALWLMISLSMYLIVSLIGAADTIIIDSARHAEKNHLEDGQFTVFVPLSDAELDMIRSSGVSVETMFFRDYALENGSVLRVFRLRSDIDLVETDSGNYPADSSGLILEKRYCETNGIAPGMEIKIAGINLLITGIGTSPDYESLLRNMSDSTADSANFGTAFVTDALYDRLSKTGKSLQSEKYMYAYRLNGAMSNDELKSILRKLSFDPNCVDDTYFRDYWNQIFGKRDGLIRGAGDLADGSRDLNEALNELEKRVNSDDLSMLRRMLPSEFLSEITALNKAGNDLADGSVKLNDAIRELTDKYWKIDAHNLRSFVPAEDNPRIGAAANDVIITKYSSILAGIIVLALLTYVISVFVIHGIEAEQSVIGTLYALGVRRRELLLHYLVLPVVISLFAGAVGTFTGYSKYGVPFQTADSFAYFSLPELHTVTEIWVIFYGVIMPSLIAALVNWIVIRRKLSATALQIMRNEEDHRDFSGIDLRNSSYIRRFQARQMLREGRSALGVISAIFVCLMLIFLGINAYALCEHVGQNNVADTKYEYMYLYKYPEKKAPEGGYAAYAETLKKEILGYNMDVTVLGLEEANPFFNASPGKSQNRVLISSAMAQKFRLKTGDSFILNDTQNDRSYAFTVDGISPYSASFFVFMDIESMRELFRADKDYFNTVFSDQDLKPDPGRLYSISTRSDVIKAADIFTDLMLPMVYTMTISSSAVLIIVMYLMMHVMIDRSSKSIALFKVFGYRRKELSKLFLNGNTLLILLGSAVSIPLAKKIIDWMYPYLVANVACDIDLHLPLWVYALIFAGIMLFYALIHGFLVSRINKIGVEAILKSRE